jgi:hypothetical protein
VVANWRLSWYRSRALYVGGGQGHVRTALQRDVDRPQISRLIQIGGAFEQERFGVLVVAADW